MQRISHAVFLERLAAQGVENSADYAFRCPMCGTVQSGRSLVVAGAMRDAVQNLIGFSCEGRLTGAGPWPSEKDKSAKARARRFKRGCDWTLGGFLKLHTLEVETADGKVHPHFEIASPEEAQALAKSLISRPVSVSA